MATATPEALAPFRELIAEEVNVKEVRVLDAADAGYRARQDLTLNPRAFSPAVRKATSRLFAAVKAGQWEVTEDGNVRFDDVLVDGAAVVLEAGMKGRMMMRQPRDNQGYLKRRR